ncbi:MAG: EAL domain-containing protein [Pseudomonadales bacterium]|nr:EAL domain-containing protein [Pseudomonadales bacterium]
MIGLRHLIGAFLRIGLLLVVSAFAHGQGAAYVDSSARATVVLNPSVSSYDLSRRIEFVEDRNHLLGINDFVQRNSMHFDWQVSYQTPNFGYTRSAYWFRVRLQNLSAVDDTLLIELPYSLLDAIDLYFADGNKVLKRFSTGDSDNFSSRPILHRHFVFPFIETKTNELDLYIRVATNGTLELPLILWRQDAFWEKEQPVLIIKGAYYGIIFIMVIYNLFIYVSVKESSYFYYVCYALSLVLFQLAIDGIAYQFFWPTASGWHGASFIIFTAFTLCFLCLFSNSFLKLQQRNRIASQILLLGSIVMLFAALSSLLLPYSIAIKLVVGLSLPISVSCFVIGLYMLLQGVTIARYFIVAWSAFLTGIVALALSKIGLLPINFITTNALQIGSALEVVLFSLALADRINSDKREKLTAKQDAIDNLRKFKSLYENAIEGIFQCTLEGDFVSVNPSMAKFMGYKSCDDFMRGIRGDKHRSFLDSNHYHEFRRAVLEQGQVLNYEAQGHRKDGTPFWCSLSAKLASDNLIEGFVVDVTDRKTSEEQLSFLARHDPLTGLVNRREFEIRLEKALLAARHEFISQGLLYMDLDQFKLVNDTCGHIAGDELLRQITIQLQQHMRSGDTLARLGGDEFGVLLENCSRVDMNRVAHKLRQVIQDFRFVWDSKIFTLGVSIGLVPIDDKSESVKRILSLADAACYAAKDAGRNRVHEYSPEDWELASKQREMQWASRITQALEENQLVLYRQKISGISSEVSPPPGAHYEILVRMLDGENEVFPGAFIPAAERYNLMPALDRWVLGTLFKWLAEDPEASSELGECAVNLSGLTLGDDDFPLFLRDLFIRYPIPPEKICFEITETVAVTNLTKTIAFIHEFKQLGCKFSLDDFGSGFSSYGYLKNLPVDYLKVDGTFVKDICIDPIDFAMVESINRIGHVMGKKTIAEFVETEDVLEKLKTLGVDYAQGFWIAKPERIDIHQQQPSLVSAK